MFAIFRQIFATTALPFFRFLLLFFCFLCSFPVGLMVQFVCFVFCRCLSFFTRYSLVGCGMREILSIQACVWCGRVQWNKKTGLGYRAAHLFDTRRLDCTCKVCGVHRNCYAYHRREKKPTRRKNSYSSCLMVYPMPVLVDACAYGVINFFVL